MINIIINIFAFLALWAITWTCVDIYERRRERRLGMRVDGMPWDWSVPNLIKDIWHFITGGNK